MKIFSDKTYDAIILKYENHVNYYKRQTDRGIEEYNKLHSEFVNHKLAEKFNFSSKIQRAVIGMSGSGKTTFLKNVARQMPYKCRAFNFGYVKEFDVSQDTLGEECGHFEPTIDWIVQRCSGGGNRGLINLIDNCAMFGIDEVKLVRELSKHGLEFIISSQSAHRIAKCAGLLDFVYAYDTLDAGYLGNHVRLENRTLKPSTI